MLELAHPRQISGEIILAVPPPHITVLTAMIKQPTPIHRRGGRIVLA